MHQSDRVRLQFGFPQYRPPVPHDLREFHTITMQTVTKALLSTRFQFQLAAWNQRRQSVIQGIPWNIEVKPDTNYMHWYLGYFGGNLFVSRPSLLGDPKTRINNPPVCLDYPPTPQPETPQPDPTYHAPQPNFPYHNPQPDPTYHAPQPNFPYHSPQPSHSYYSPQPNFPYHSPYHSPQPAHSYHSPQPNDPYHTPQPNIYDQTQNTFHYPSFQNSAVTYGNYSDSNQHSSSHHMSSAHEESSHTSAESSHHSHSPFELPPAYLQTFSELPSQPSQSSLYPPTTQTSLILSEIANELMAPTPPSPIVNEATMNSLWAGSAMEQAEVEERLGRGQRKKLPKPCGTRGHKERDHRPKRGQ